MATITISQQDLAEADAFLTSYLKEKVPDADFTKGGVIRDFVITAIAHVFAFLESERKTTRDQQSLLALSQLADDQSVSDAVNALLSNWFLNRKTGLNARLTARLHFSTASDVTLAPTTRFIREAGLVFVPDITSGIVIPAAELTPTFDANNVVIDYTTTVNLVSQLTGTAYNVPAGRFIQADQFNPYFTFAENQADIQGGKNTESTSELLLRAPTAISVRNLVNSRSIDTVLRETFAGLTRVLSIGFGDPEMLRDFSSEAVTRLRMHVGGFTDIYVQLPVTEVVESGTLGGVFTRPDNVIALFKDATANFLASPTIVPGDILRIVAGLPDAPREYIVDTVSTNQITVSPRAAFSEPTDETGTYVSYTLGDIAPGYDNKRVVTTLGQTSRAIQTPGRITLQGRPHYRIKKVELFITTAFISVPSSRVNTAPATGEYRVIAVVPANAQSAYTVDQVEVFLPDYSTGIWTMRVTYDTLVNYADVQALVIDRFERILASNPLVKGYTPVYISLGIAYKVKIGSTSTLDTVAAAQSMAAFINNFDLTTTLDLTNMLQHLRDNFAAIGVIISPTVLTYDLFASDGQVFSYSSADIITVYPSYPDNNAHLINGAGLRVPILNANLDPTITSNEPLFAAANKTLKDQLNALGVSDRSLIYLTTPADITFTLVN